MSTPEEKEHVLNQADTAADLDERETADPEAPETDLTHVEAEPAESRSSQSEAAAQLDAEPEMAPDVAADPDAPDPDLGGPPPPDFQRSAEDRQFSEDAGEPASDAGEPEGLGASDPEAEGAEEEGEAADADGAILTATNLPDLADEAVLHSALEALLLVVDSPAEDELLADALDQPVKRIREALVTLAAQYHEQHRGIDLRNIGGGWRLYTRDRYAPYVEKMLLDGQRAKLTRAALESLAVIAYRQPVTRARVAAVRGVNVDGVIRTLLARGLIEETGTDKDTGGILYRTTELFLERLGLSSLEDLPPIAPLLPEVDAIDDV